MVDGLMASGDVGHFDSEGRLYVDGRDDEMIVSGGENVFPAEVEELLGAHDDIHEAAAIGVDDEKFGQRLKAFVVLRDGAELDEDDIKGYVKENLANYKVPRESCSWTSSPATPPARCSSASWPTMATVPARARARRRKRSPARVRTRSKVRLGYGRGREVRLGRGRRQVKRQGQESERKGVRKEGAKTSSN